MRFGGFLSNFQLKGVLRKVMLEYWLYAVVFKYSNLMVFNKFDNFYYSPILLLCIVLPKANETQEKGRSPAPVKYCLFSSVQGTGADPCIWRS